MHRRAGYCHALVLFKFVWLDGVGTVFPLCRVVTAVAASCVTAVIWSTTESICSVWLYKYITHHFASINMMLRHLLPLWPFDASTIHCHVVDPYGVSGTGCRYTRRAWLLNTAWSTPQSPVSQGSTPVWQFMTELTDNPVWLEAISRFVDWWGVKHHWVKRVRTACSHLATW